MAKITCCHIITSSGLLEFWRLLVIMAADSSRNRKQSDRFSVSRNNRDDINIETQSDVRNTLVCYPHKFIFCQFCTIKPIIGAKKNSISVDNFGTVSVFDKNQVWIVDFEESQRWDQLSPMLKTNSDPFFRRNLTFINKSCIFFIAEIHFCLSPAPHIIKKELNWNGTDSKTVLFMEHELSLKILGRSRLFAWITS